MSRSTSPSNQVSLNWPSYLSGGCTVLSFALGVLVVLGTHNCLPKALHAKWIKHVGDLLSKEGTLALLIGSTFIGCGSTLYLCTQGNRQLQTNPPTNGTSVKPTEANPASSQVNVGREVDILPPVVQVNAPVVQVNERAPERLLPTRAQTPLKEEDIPYIVVPIALANDFAEYSAQMDEWRSFLQPDECCLFACNNVFYFATDKLPPFMFGNKTSVCNRLNKECLEKNLSLINLHELKGRKIIRERGYPLNKLFPQIDCAINDGSKGSDHFQKQLWISLLQKQLNPNEYCVFSFFSVEKKDTTYLAITKEERYLITFDLEKKFSGLNAISARELEARSRKQS